MLKEVPKVVFFLLIFFLTMNRENSEIPSKSNLYRLLVRNEPRDTLTRTVWGALLAVDNDKMHFSRHSFSARIGFSTHVNEKECSASPSSQKSFSVLCFVRSSIYLKGEKC